MNESADLAMRAHTSTRRQTIFGAAIALGGLVTGLRAQAPLKADHSTLTSLRQEVELKASAQRIYEALLNSKQFTAFTGVAAVIDPTAGGAFTLFEGQVTGRNIETVANQRIVQAWRPGDWPAGVYSIVRFELKPVGSGTAVVLNHTGFPAGEFDSLDSGWHEHYWEPLKKFLA